MNTRSTANAYVHFGGEVISNVESSHGVRLSGGSTGGVVESFGDDANVSLTVRGQGTGGVVLGNSSQTVSLAGSASLGSATTPMAIAGSSIALTSTHTVINSTRVVFGTSTTAISGMQRYLIEFAIPTMAATTNAVSTVTVTGLTTGGALFMSQRLAYATVAGLIVTPRCSSANELSLTIANPSASTITGSTVSAWLFQINF